MTLMDQAGLTATERRTMMGKRNFAMTCSADVQKTEASKFGNNLSVWVRGWGVGLEINTSMVDDHEFFEVWQTGGSNAKSNGRKLIGTFDENEGWENAT